MSNVKAQAQYHARRNEIEHKLEEITRLVAEHRATADAALHWGHVGDLALVAEQLDEAIKFMSN